jgi:hypothetical protein
VPYHHDDEIFNEWSRQQRAARRWRRKRKITAAGKPMTVRYIIPTEILKVERRDRVVMTCKDFNDPTGNAVVEERIDLGWFVHFQGSNEAIGLGHEMPNPLPKPHTKARIVLEWD